MIKNKHKLKGRLILEHLHPDNLEAVFTLLNNVEVECKSRMLSILEHDRLDDDYSLVDFFRSYFNGERVNIENFNIEKLDSLDLSALEKLDMIYRNDIKLVSQDWLLDNILSLINSRRAFAIACKLNFKEVIDCFLEKHSIEWLGDCISLLKDENLSSSSSLDYVLSDDRSAKKIGDYFFIHSGTNHWNRAWLPTTKWSPEWDVHLRNWRTLIQRVQKFQVSNQIPEVQFLFVPEKDTLTRATMPEHFQSGDLPYLIMLEYFKSLPKDSAVFPVLELASKVPAETRLRIPDSHLSAMDYWEIFKIILTGWGLERYAPKKVDFSYTEIYGDLGGKFGLNPTQRQTIEFDLASPEIVAGQDTLQIPLRDNHIALYNSSAPIKKSLLILGDSHSSTYTNPFLTYIASHLFQEVEFFWNSFMLNDLKTKHLHFSKFDYLLSEVSQRFVTPAIPPAGS